MVQQNLQSMLIYIAAGAYAPEEIVEPVVVVNVGERLRDVWRGLDAESVRRRAGQQFGTQPTIVDLGASHPAPCFIDIHTHGFRGFDLTTGPSADASAMASALCSTGVTAFLPSIASTGRAETPRQVGRTVRLRAAR